MTGMQDKIMAVVRTTIEKEGLECVEKWDWSNVGCLYVQRPKALVTLFMIDVNFQSNRMQGAIRYQGEHLVNGFTYKGNLMVRDRSFLMDYCDGAGLAAFMNKVSQIASEYIMVKGRNRA